MPTAPGMMRSVTYAPASTVPRSLMMETTSPFLMPRASASTGLIHSGWYWYPSAPREVIGEVLEQTGRLELQLARRGRERILHGIVVEVDQPRGDLFPIGVG